MRARGAARRPRSSAKRDPGCPGVPVDAGVRALDAASGSETRYPHRRRPPGERPAVGTMTSVDEIAGASAPATCARATRQVACDKHFLLHRAHVSCLEPHTHLVLQRERMRQRPELDPNLHPLTPSAVLVSCSQAVDRFRADDLPPRLEGHREGMPRPMATEMGSRGAILVS